MNRFKRIGQGILAVMVLALCVVPAAAAEGDVELVGALGVLQGEGLGLTPDYLTRTTTRLQAAVITMRLMGAEETALNYDGDDNFADADMVRWVEGRNLLAYLHDNMEQYGWRGYPDHTFRPYDPATPLMIYKITLVALGYTEDVDFTWADVRAFAADRGLSEIGDLNTLTNADLAVALVEGLRADMATGDSRLVDVLIPPDELEPALAGLFAGKLAATRDRGLDGLPDLIAVYRNWFDLAPQTNTADHAYRTLLMLHDQLAGEAYARLFPDAANYYMAAGFDHTALADPDTITDPGVADTVRLLHECGYEITSREGMLEITRAPSFLLSFRPYVTDPLAEYIALLAGDIIEPIAIDAELQVSWNELARRAVAYDELARAHPALPEAGISQQRAELYMTFYLRGIDNTPLFDWTDDHLTPDVRASYQWFLEEYPESRFAPAVSEFLDVLEQNDFQLTDAVKEYMQQPLPWQGPVDR